MRKTFAALAALTILAAPAAYAQDQGAGAAAGAATGAVGGAIVGGPVGAAVGGVTGAIVGGIAADQQPRFREYVVERPAPNYTYRETVRVGTVLPQSGVTYREVPEEYGRGYRYTTVNDRVVVVDPGTRRVVQIIE
ncbi:DUF1236 domain-containing protein [Chelatococcus reniformis]|uniref:Glycine zipper domain-containing protein n=1 Tax=Chelatococcus reniformis TaxID=1494448 RepID=A0A916XMG7_9HYPH|nr:DUF1236 domain-containing protein [Chelatococcus reniformis]GGC84030.1 hypothetical protein GCM10010994_47410 [Chelatococcus reniformis]